MKKIDYSPSGQSPLAPTLQMLKSELRVSEKKRRGGASLLSIGGIALESLKEEHIHTILKQCKLYEMNVMRNKVDEGHIATLRQMLEDLHGMIDLRSKAIVQEQ